jgi:hypothetical protein
MSIFYLSLLHVTIIHQQRASDFYVLLIIKTERFSKQGKLKHIDHINFFSLRHVVLYLLRYACIVFFNHE